VETALGKDAPKDRCLRLESKSPDAIATPRIPFTPCSKCEVPPPGELPARGALGVKQVHLMGLAHHAHTALGMSQKDARAYSEKTFPTNPKELVDFLMRPP